MAKETMEAANGIPAARNMAGKYLTFQLGDESYGIPVMNVQEIVALMPITRIPRVEDYVRGVINLRGKIIPVFDLRKKFAFGSVEETRRTCIIIVEIGFGKDLVTGGIIVDKVAEVLSIGEDEIDLNPDFGSMVRADCILGLGRVKDQIKILLDVEKVFSSKEMKETAQTAS